MKNFIKDVFIVLISFIVFYVFMLFIGYKVIGNQYSKNYQASMNKKLERLKKTNDTKIILVGDSNLTFGIDSKMIEDNLDMKVVNLGVHAMLGNRYVENVALENINKGDIVVISNVDYMDEYYDPELVWITNEWNKSLWKFVPIDKYFETSIMYPKYMYKSFKEKLNGNKSSTDAIYSIDNIDSYGEVFVRPDTTLYKFDKDSVVVPTISDKYIKRVNNFNDKVNDLEASLVMTTYPIGSGEYTPKFDEFLKFQKELEDKLDFPVISNFTNYYIPYEYFYDTKYHLTLDGREIRTKQLIVDLRNYIEANL